MFTHCRTYCTGRGYGSSVCHWSCGDGKDAVLRGSACGGFAGGSAGTAIVLAYAGTGDIHVGTTTHGCARNGGQFPNSSTGIPTTVPISCSRIEFTAGAGNFPGRPTIAVGPGRTRLPQPIDRLTKGCQSARISIQPGSDAAGNDSVSAKCGATACRGEPVAG